MEFDGLGTPCLLYCGSCRYFMNNECKGCGTASREGCTIRECCVEQQGLRFCSECEEFPCEVLERSVGVHPKWLEDQARFPARVWD